MLCDQLTIRPTGPEDTKAIHKVESEAYGRKDEALLAEALIPAPPVTFSFLAECQGKPAGHILLTEIEAPVRALALAPLAVVPEFREMHVGTTLVRHALEAARSHGFEAVFVLGDNMYYERFGFSSSLADPFRIKWQGKRFMAIEIKPGCLAGKSGKLDYPEPFYNLDGTSGH